MTATQQNGWDTTLSDAIKRVGTDVAQRLSAQLKAEGFTGIAMLDEMQRRLVGITIEQSNAQLR